MPKPVSKYHNTVNSKSKKVKREEKEVENSKKGRKVHDPYPWDQWFEMMNKMVKETPNRPASIVLKRGKDFNCMLHSMATQIRNVASHIKYGISVRIDGDEIIMTKKRGFTANA